MLSALFAGAAIGREPALAQLFAAKGRSYRDLVAFTHPHCTHIQTPRGADGDQPRPLHCITTASGSLLVFHLFELGIDDIVIGLALGLLRLAFRLCLPAFGLLLLLIHALRELA